MPSLHIENHFLAQSLYDFSDITFYIAHSEVYFEISSSKYSISDIIDFCYVKDNKVVSMIEVWINHKQNQIVLSFVETILEYRKLGYAKALYKELLSWMAKNYSNMSLSRGCSSLQCPKEFTASIDSLLETSRIECASKMSLR